MIKIIGESITVESRVSGWLAPNMDGENLGDLIEELIDSNDDCEIKINTLSNRTRYAVNTLDQIHSELKEFIGTQKLSKKAKESLIGIARSIATLSGESAKMVQNSYDDSI